MPFWEVFTRSDIQPQIRLRKIPVVFWSTFEDMQQALNQADKIFGIRNIGRIRVDMCPLSH